MMAWSQLCIVWIAALLGCAIGFKKFIWFLSIGYGLAIACGAIAIACIFHSSLNWISVFQIAVLVFYGLRLGIFLLSREMKSASYRKTLAQATASEKKMPIFVLILMWLMVGALYAMQVSPVLYRLVNGSSDVVCPVIGAVISLVGACMEAEADREKSAQKALRPNMVATEGLYKLVRCPNYLGEMLVWLGVLVGSVTTLRGGQWLLAIISFIAICYIMFDGAKRLEERQNKRLAGNAEYEVYVNSTPIIIPFIPLYHLTGGKKK